MKNGGIIHSITRNKKKKNRFIGSVISAISNSTGAFLEGIGSAVALSSTCAISRPSDSEAIRLDFWAVGKDIEHSILVFSSSLEDEAENQKL